MNWDLGNGWCWAPLSSLLLPARKQITPTRIGANLQYVGLEHVIGGSGQYRSVSAGDASLKSSKFQFEAGDLLYGKLRPNLRKCVVATHSGVCSTDLVPLRPKTKAAAYFLALQLRSQPFTESVMRMIGGASLPRVNVKDLLSIKVPVPPMAKADRMYESAACAWELRRSLRDFERSVLEVEASLTSRALGLAGAEEAIAVKTLASGSAG